MLKIGYADYLILVFNDQKHLQDALTLMIYTFERYSLKLNTAKTKTIIFNYNLPCPRTIATVGDIEIENLKHFRYLGSEIKFDEPGTEAKEIQLRIDCSTDSITRKQQQRIN